MKVLIIDDEDDIRRIAQLSLSKVGGMEVIQASGGAEGVAQAKLHKPDAILLDVMMPSIDGPTTLGLLLKDVETSGIPVIFLTAKAMSQEVDDLKSLGARGVLTKPFDPMLLAGQVKELLA